MTLYELTAAMKELEAMEDIDPQTIVDTLESLNMEFDDKLYNIGRWVRNMEAESAGIKSEEERLYKKRKALEAKVERLKEYVRLSMLATGKKKVSDGIITWGIQANPPKVTVLNEEAIPLCYYTENVIRDLDRNAIKQAIVGGFAVPGVVLESHEGVRLR